jgi:hypothetical protein
MMETSAVNKKLIFCLLFSATSCVVYLLCDLYKLPLFTYYPAVNEFALGFVKMTESQGPAMYWYGWICTTTLVATGVAWLISQFATSPAVVKFVASGLSVLTWILIPFFINSLTYYWKHA